MYLITVNEEQDTDLFAIYFTTKLFNQMYITNKTEHFSFKNRHTMCTVKLIKMAYRITVLKTTLFKLYHYSRVGQYTENVALPIIAAT